MQFAITDLQSGNGRIGIYVHIPFCQSICSYRNFNRGLLDGDLKRRYVDALEREILSACPACPERSRGGQSRGDTLFFGGGTPSLLDPAEVGRLIAACRESFDLAADAEITLETNPETATAERLEGFRRAGVNRLSFGVQSFDDDELRRLGRVHSAARAAEAVGLAQATGFESVSFDLMFWLPEQTFDSWRRTVDRAIALGPDHLSLYLLELYPNAPIREAIARGGWAQAPDDVAADMYLAALESLDRAGFAQYEISNVARPGRKCRHNVKYWTAGDWHGFGCGAHSTVDGVRWKNVASTAEYVARVAEGRPVRQDEHALDLDERRAEALFTGLRLNAGIDRGNFLARFGVDPWAPYAPALDPLVEDGLMWANPTAFGLTRRGMLLSNEILATFV